MSYLPLVIVLACFFGLGDAVYGGTEASINEFPWMVLLEYTKPNGKGFHCAGVLINKDYVLTAANCVKNPNMERMRWTLSGVRLGEQDLKTDIDCEDGSCADPVVNIPVADRIPHPNYDMNSHTSENDIALLRLERSVQFTDWIKPIKLPESVNTDVGSTSFVVAGWGKTENASRSDVKLMVELNGVSLEKCNHAYRHHSLVLSENHLCAGDQPGKDSCRGDTGGPLMAVNNNDPSKPYYLAGIVSFGPVICGSGGIPGVYTKVDKYTKWIADNSQSQ